MTSMPCEFPDGPMCETPAPWAAWFCENYPMYYSWLCAKHLLETEKLYRGTEFDSFHPCYAKGKEPDPRAMALSESLKAEWDERRVLTPVSKLMKLPQLRSQFIVRPASREPFINVLQTCDVEPVEGSAFWLSMQRQAEEEMP